MSERDCQAALNHVRGDRRFAQAVATDAVRSGGYRTSPTLRAYLSSTRPPLQLTPEELDRVVEAARHLMQAGNPPTQAQRRPGTPHPRETCADKRRALARAHRELAGEAIGSAFTTAGAVIAGVNAANMPAGSGRDEALAGAIVTGTGGFVAGALALVERGFAIADAADQLRECLETANQPADVDRLTQAIDALRAELRELRTRGGTPQRRRR